jgi:hypothetical protein
MSSNPYYSLSPGNTVDPRGLPVDEWRKQLKKVYEWANLEEFIAEFNKPPAQGRQPVPEGKRSLLRGTFRKLRLGWASPEMKDQLKKFHELYQFIKATVTSKLPKTEYRPKLVGSRANIAGIVVGDPRTAIGRKPSLDASKRRASSKLIRLCCNVDAFSGVTMEYFFIRGAAMCALAEALEAAKFRVEITIAIASTPIQRPVLAKVQDGPLKAKPVIGFHHGYDWTDANDIEAAREKNQRYFIRLKPFAVPVAPLQIAFAMMHPGVLRTLFFTWWHHYIPNNGEQQIWYNEGAGCVGTVPEGHDGTYDVYVAGFDPHNPASTYKNKDGAVAWVLETLKGFGVEVGK